MLCNEKKRSQPIFIPTAQILYSSTDFCAIKKYNKQRYGFSAIDPLIIVRLALELNSFIHMELPTKLIDSLVIQKVLPVEVSMLNSGTNSSSFPVKSENNNPFHSSGYKILSLQNNYSTEPIMEFGMLAMQNSDQLGVQTTCNDQILICAAAGENNPEPNPNYSQSSLLKNIVGGILSGTWLTQVFIGIVNLFSR